MVVLVERNEEGCLGVCGIVLHLSIGEGGASAPREITATTIGVKVEVGPHYYRFCVLFVVDQ